MNQYKRNIIKIVSTIQCTQETQRPIDIHVSDVASQTSPQNQGKSTTEPRNCHGATEQPPGNQTGNEPVPFLSCSNSCPTDIQE